MGGSDGRRLLAILTIPDQMVRTRLDLLIWVKVTPTLQPIVTWKAQQTGIREMIRILMADSHDVVRAGLRSVIEGHPCLSIVAEAADGREAIDKCIATQPDVAVLAYALSEIDGLEATRQIRRRVPGVEVLIFTAHDNEILMRDLFQAGARGIVLKSDSSQDLIAAIKSLGNRKPFLTSKASDVLREALIDNKRSTAFSLTLRERAIVRLVAAGHTNKQIARALAIAVKTVEAHRAMVLQKLRLDSSAALVRYAIRNKLVEA
jgi:DNA-binding NarL/FixJ family response regulator